jgi:hypothetical protein
MLTWHSNGLHKIHIEQNMSETLTVQVKNDMLKQKDIKLSIFLFSIITFLISIIIGINYFSSVLIYSSLLLNIFYLIVQTVIKKNIPFFIVILFISRYILPLYYPLFTDIQFGAFTDTASSDDRYLYFNIAQIQLLFTSTFALFLNIEKRDNLTRVYCIDNKFYYFVCLSIFMFFTFFGKTGEGLRSGDYGSGAGVDTISSAFEYAIIPFIGAAIFSYNRKRILLLHIASLYYIAKNTLFGGRVESIMILLVLYLFFYKDKIKFKYIVFGIIILIYILGVIGRFRADPRLLFNGEFYDLLMPVHTNRSDIQLIITQESEVNYSSVTILKLIKDGIVVSLDRIKALIWFIISLFVPSSYTEPIANLSTYAKNYNNNLGGGLISVYFYLYAGYLGVLFIAYLISNFLNYFNRSKLDYKSIYSIFVIVTIFRWYPYSPVMLFKLCIFGTLFIVSLIYLSNKKIILVKNK